MGLSVVKGLQEGSFVLLFLHLSCATGPIKVE